MLVSFRVGVDLFTRELRARGAFAGRIADQTREITDEKDRRVAQFLKRAQLANHHRVTEMNVGRGRIRAEFHTQWLAGLGRLFQLRSQFVFANYFGGAFAQISKLFVYRHRGQLSKNKSGMGQRQY